MASFRSNTYLPFFYVSLAVIVPPVCRSARRQVHTRQNHGHVIGSVAHLIHCIIAHATLRATTTTRPAVHANILQHPPKSGYRTYSLFIDYCHIIYIYISTLCRPRFSIEHRKPLFFVVVLSGPSRLRSISTATSLAAASKKPGGCCCSPPTTVCGPP